MSRKKTARPTRVERLERIAQDLEKYADRENPRGRVLPPLFTDPAEHGGVDAPGWCRKMARRYKKRARKSRKNFEAKQIDREKHRRKRLRREGEQVAPPED